MFQGAFLPNLCVFLLAQAVALGYLRTGLVARGVALLVGSWVLADVALVARFAYDHAGVWFLGSLALLQAWTFIEALRFLIGRVARRRRAFVARRAQLGRQAFIAYLRNDLGVAVTGYRQMVRSDPWDLAARVGMGRALLRQGHRRRGLRALKAARRLDRDGRYGELIDAVSTAGVSERAEPDEPAAQQSA